MAVGVRMCRGKDRFGNQKRLMRDAAATTVRTGTRRAPMPVTVDNGTHAKGELDMKLTLLVSSILVGALSASCGTQHGMSGARTDLQANGPNASGPVSDHPIQRIAPTTSGRMSSSGTAASSPGSRAEIQAAGTDALHNGLYPRGDALATERRPHGGPVGADAAQRMGPAEIVPGRRWGSTDQAD